ncbi:MAG: hypothetical protein QME35_03680 [Thermoanaerobacteraceae bacterium]|nr:hypothetical protein [Thermoanaerobacteraceae bacterium]
MYNGLLKSLKKNEDGFTLALVLVVLSALLILAGTASYLSVRTSRAAIDDRSLVQARCAADTGIERARLYLSIFPFLRANIIPNLVSNYTIDNTSKNTYLEIMDDDQKRPNVVKIVSTGECRGVKKTVTAYVQLSTGTLFKLIYPGFMRLPSTSQYQPWQPENAIINSDVYLNGDLVNKATIKGNVYAAGKIKNYGHIYGQSNSNWKGKLPDITKFSDLIDRAVSIAGQLSSILGNNGHYFNGSHTFTSYDLSNMNGYYFVNGDVTINGGTTNQNKICIVSTGQININGNLNVNNNTNNLVLISKDNFNFAVQYKSNYNFALGLSCGGTPWTANNGESIAIGYEYFLVDHTGLYVAPSSSGGITFNQYTNNTINLDNLYLIGYSTTIISRTEK